MKILLNKQAEKFMVTGRYTEQIAPSSDGMRRGCSYEVYTKTVFSFLNEEQLEGGYSYDLQVVKTTSDHQQPRELAETSAEFTKNFDFIVSALRKRGLELISSPSYVKVTCKLHPTMMYACGEEVFVTESDEDALEVEISSAEHPATAGDQVIEYHQLLTYLREGGKDWKQLRIARAIGDDTLVNREFKIAFNSLTAGGLHDGRQFFKLKKVSPSAMLESGLINETGIKQALLDFAERAREAESYHPISTDGLEDYILDLPKEQISEVLKYSQQSPQNLDLFRTYCPERIYWRDVALEDMRDSDLDLMIQRKEYAYTSDQWEFIDRCMESPELEQKVVANAYLLGQLNPSRIIRNLRTQTTRDIFRSVCCYLAENFERVDIRNLRDLFDAEYEGLECADYEICLSLVRNLRVDTLEDVGRAGAFVLRIGILAGVDESELARVLQEEYLAGDHHVELCSARMRQAYQELNFAPGFAWIKAGEERIAEHQRLIAAEQARSNDAVVKFAQQSGKVATCVTVESLYWSNSDQREIKSLDGDEIGCLQADEQRVMLLEGWRYGYLINIARAKNPKNGVLHIDIMDCDAGYIIGKKGANLEKTAQRLRDLGCNVRTIRVHKHEEP